VVAISELDLSALLSMELLEEGIKVVARANTELQARLLRKLGVEKIIMLQPKRCASRLSTSGRTHLRRNGDLHGFGHGRA